MVIKNIKLLIQEEISTYFHQKILVKKSTFKLMHTMHNY
jgi:hypothetical protein